MRFSSCLILAIRSSLNRPKFLIATRCSNSRRLPNYRVFPGGVISSSDFSEKWIELLSQVDDPFKLIYSSTRPSTFYDYYRYGRNTVPSEIGFRIAALRETLEECGILRIRDCSTQAGSFLDPDLSNEWRRLVATSTTTLLDLCGQHYCVPDIWALHEWSCWLTPHALITTPSIVHTSHQQTRRNSTAFFISCASECDVTPTCQPGEIQAVSWSDASEEIRANMNALMPPQIYELSRLRHFDHYSQLFDFVTSRAHRGISTTLPVIFRTRDQRILSVLPGDELYPRDAENITEIQQLEQNYEQLDSRRVHRFVDMRTIQCNIHLPYGHISPVTN